MLKETSAIIIACWQMCRKRPIFIANFNYYFERSVERRARQLDRHDSFGGASVRNAGAIAP